MFCRPTGALSGVQLSEVVFHISLMHLISFVASTPRADSPQSGFGQNALTGAAYCHGFHGFCQLGAPAGISTSLAAGAALAALAQKATS